MAADEVAKDQGLYPEFDAWAETVEMYTSDDWYLITEKDDDIKRKIGKLRRAYCGS